MKQLLTLAAAVLITGTVLTPGFAQDKMGKMDKMGGEKKMAGKMDKMPGKMDKMAGKMQCAECAKLTKKAGKPTECAACKKMHAAMKAKMSSGNKMSGDKKKM